MIQRDAMLVLLWIGHLIYLLGLAANKVSVYAWIVIEIIGDAHAG